LLALRRCLQNIFATDQWWASLRFLIVLNACSPSKEQGLKCSVHVQWQWVSDEVIYECARFALTEVYPEELNSTGYRLLDRDYMDYSFAEEEWQQLQQMDCLFSPADLRFIALQQRQSTRFYWDMIRLPLNGSVSSDTLERYFKEAQRKPGNFWDKIHRKWGRKGMVILSLPLFTLDHQTVVLRISEQSGAVWGGGGTYVYHKTNGHWKRIATPDAWMS
jgi:hypothetical protein